MTPNPYLQHLIPDPTYGYLFPHRMTIAALGLPNVYQLNKHRPSLTEGRHWIKILGSDHVERLYYTRDGLLLLCELSNTAAAQQFKQELMRHSQPGGAIVPSHPTALYPPPTRSAALYSDPTDEDSPETSIAAPNVPIDPQSHHPAALVAQHLAPLMESAIERSVQARMPVQPIQPVQSRSTPDLLFEQQRLDLEKQQAWTESLLKAQSQVQQQTPTQITVQVNLLKRWDSWLSQQDPWAMLLIFGALFTALACGSYLLVASTVRSPAPTYQTQSWH